MPSLHLILHPDAEHESSLSTWSGLPENEVLCVTSVQAASASDGEGGVRLIRPIARSFVTPQPSSPLDTSSPWTTLMQVCCLRTEGPRAAW